MNIAFAGNPNVGKTAIINNIAGSNLKVGNWPGVTVEKKEATLILNGKQITLTDLPGVYSLSSYTIEERITRDFILDSEVDCIINVLDSTNLERNLYLTLLLMELEKPMIIALNMYDEFKKLGYKIDLEGFKNILGINIVPTSAIKKEGLDELIKQALNLKGRHSKLKYRLRYEGFIEDEIKNVVEKLKKENLQSKYPLRWIAIKLIEKDEYIIEKLRFETKKDLSTLAKDNIMRIEERFDEDSESVLTEIRYGIINGILKKVLKKPQKIASTITEKLDSIFINRVLGIPVFMFFMYFVFKFTFDGSAPFIDWIDGFINGYLAKYLSIALSNIVPGWLNSLLIDGVLGGVGVVLSFVPLMVFLYFFLALLEESGYMARAAFVMDKVMNSLGLNGKAFIPMILGFGCNVPAIYATRALENESDRKLVAVMVPFMSCGARLPIYALFTATFFLHHQALIVLSLYVIGIVIAFIVGLVLRKTSMFKAEKTPLLLELPPYRIPSLRILWISSWTRTKSFISKAGTVIALTMILIWGAIHLPINSTYETSFLARSAKVVTPLFKPAGFNNWQIVAAIIPGLIAKETVVGALAQTLNIEEESNQNNSSNFIQDTTKQLSELIDAFFNSCKAMFFNISQETFKLESISNKFKKRISQVMTPLSAYSFMVFMLLFIPCIVTLAAIKQEFGWKLMFFEIWLLIFISYIASVIVYQMGSLLYNFI